MGLLGDLILEAILNSDTKLGNAANKSVNYITKSNIETKKRVLLDEQIKAQNEGNKERADKIKKERAKYK